MNNQSACLSKKLHAKIMNSKILNKFSIEMIDLNKKDIFEKLLQEYLSELNLYLNEFTKDKNGNYFYEYKDKYFVKDSKKNGDFAYFIKSGNDIAGFILVTRAHLVLESVEHNYAIAELFVANKYKKQGLASFAVEEILNIHKGNFEVKPFSKNPAAVEFWKKIITKYTNKNFEIKISNNGSKVYVFSTNTK